MHLTAALRTGFLSAVLLCSAESVAFGQVNPNPGSSGTIRADFNGDGFRDLAIGAPYEDLDGIVDAGAVYVIYGSAAGLVAPASSGTTPRAQSWTQNSAGVPGVPEEGDRFGAALAAGDFNNDGITDLAIGIPGEDVVVDNFLGRPMDVRNLGSVVIIYGTPQGLSVSAANYPAPSAINPPSKFSTDGDGLLSGYSCTPYLIQGFGEAVVAGDFDGDGAIDLAVGAPSTDRYGSMTYCSNPPNVGLVAVLYGQQATPMTSAARTAYLVQEDLRSNPTTFEKSEAYDGFGSSLTAGDFDRNGRTDLVVGAHAEDYGEIAAAGMVQVFFGCSSSLNQCSRITISQGTAGIESSPEEGDLFGYSLATGDFNGDGRDDLAIGVPYEDIVSDRTGSLTTISDAGEVDVLYGSALGLSRTVRTPHMWHQDVINVEGVAETGDLFGSSLTSGNFGAGGTLTDLAVGITMEKVMLVRCGAIGVLYGSTTNNGLSATGDQLWHQEIANVPGACEAGDLWGTTLR